MVCWIKYTFMFMKHIPWGAACLLSLGLMSIILCGVLFGCKGRVEQVFIINNDNASHRGVIVDCFVRILSPPGQIPRDYNVKTIYLLFRDAEHQTVFNKEIEISAAQIKPKIDWRAYPQVQISFKNDSSEERVYSVTLPERARTEPAEGVTP
jgi:hypothetical protein